MMMGVFLMSVKRITLMRREYQHHMFISPYFASVVGGECPRGESSKREGRSKAK